MNCRKCGGNLVMIEDTIVQCENCHTKYRIKPTASQQNVSNETSNKTTEEPKKEEKIEIEYKKPFSSHEEQNNIEKLLSDVLNDDLNRTINDDLKSKLVINSIEPEIQDYKNSQDVNDEITEYEHENYPETREIQEKIYCSNCGAFVDLKTGICPECSNVMPLPKKMTITCPFCQYEKNNINSEFCIKCGRDLDIERERLGIVIERKEVPKSQQSSQHKKKEKEEDKENISVQKISASKIFLSIISIIVIVAEIMALVKFNFVASNDGSFALNLGNIIDIIKSTSGTETNLQDLLTTLNFGDKSIEYFTANTMIFQALTISVLIFIATSIIYVLMSVYGILKKSLPKSLLITSILNFISTIALSGIGVFIINKVVGSLVIGLFGPIMGMVIAFILMCITVCLV